MESKITVKHYINKDLNPKIESGKLEYPLYVQVTYKRKSYKFRSSNSFFNYLSEDSLNNDLINGFLKKEKENITKVVELISKRNLKLLTSKNLSFLSKDLGLTIEENFKKLLVKECKATPYIFKNASYTEIENILFFFRVSLSDSPEISGNSKIENVKYCIDKIGYTGIGFYDDNYLGIDLYFGKKLVDLYEIMTLEVGENSANECLKDMREFIEM